MNGHFWILCYRLGRGGTRQYMAVERIKKPNLRYAVNGEDCYDPFNIVDHTIHFGRRCYTKKEAYKEVDKLNKVNERVKMKLPLTLLIKGQPQIEDEF